MNFQSLKTWLLKGPHQQGIQICTDFHIFIIIMETSSHILWQAINKHEKKIQLWKYLKKKTQEYYLTNFCSLNIPWGGS
jgi:hypothetical protein